MKTIIESQNLSAIFGAKQNNGGSFTVVSKKTGKDYTFKVANKSWKGVTYTHVSVETEYLNFKYLGTFFNGKIFHKRQVVESPSAVAIAWLLVKVQESKFDLLDESVEILHLGNCIRCGRTLTDVQSIERGLGSECARNLGVSTTKVKAEPKAEPKAKEWNGNYNVVKKYTNEYARGMGVKTEIIDYNLSWEDATMIKDSKNLYFLDDCTECYYIESV